MRALRILFSIFLICATAMAFESRLPFKTVFKGEPQFHRLVSLAKENDWKSLPIGERTGGQLDAGKFPALHRGRPLPGGRLHRRISFAPALSGGLALRQQSPRT